MHYLKYHGIIINRRVVKDSDRFLTIYTLEQGKISVYARGIRSVKSKRGSQLDLFSHIRFDVIEKNDRMTLTSVELLDGHHVSKTTLANISRLFQIGELIDRLTVEHDRHTEVYDLLVLALANLARFETPEYIFRFKKKLLELLGYGDFDNQDIDTFIDSLLTHPLRAKIN
ncbi:DNA repair protein RecO [Candidatus Collierbacteria bacterium CG17_big_fil_post_rev_8_21_14_2_50_45_7]|uniref:DNA repair protein RecO n=1 Tax=Candidatus Collierbacteria bacterium CG17_big_fil_post_rev_8_21_14_2_50_45_7 TaxID=1974536 RepID=A0A2M7FRK3_9BACT|nr:MAG: DNA repair protein RecO [Candidatus Collierbacteria bacterium CG17_big_fil_post_rev_8_21_14_2_50_45_7]